MIEVLRNKSRQGVTLFSVLVAVFMIFTVVQLLIAAEDEITIADLSDSSKDVNKAEAYPGSVLQYTVVISNSGTTFAAAAITDTLPAGLTYQPGSLSVVGGGPLYGESGGVITWTGAVNANTEVIVRFNATVNDAVLPDTTITNSVEINDGSTLFERSAVTFIVAEPPTRTLYLPIISRALPAMAIGATRPNSSNQWTVSWESIQGATSYEVQESHSPDFATLVQTYNVSAANSQAIAKSPSFRNVYFYRARARTDSQIGPWSNVIQVRGAYRDDFNDNSSGWAVRRTTFIEKVQSFYEIDQNRNWLILRVEDSWDWGIASPLTPAPEPPYAIEYRIMPANLGNLVSFGAVFGGDWNGQDCPDKTSVAGWYEHEICFNVFYNTNTIWFGGLKLLFERVDNLVWCPECMGSPMKRLGDINPNAARDLTNVEPNGWNTYRIEVRPNDIRFFANGVLQHTYGDTRYINNPYFGIFASTDEYSNSTARLEYFSVTPLDQ